MRSESARMSSAAEARYRIDAPNSQPRTIKIIALDAASEVIVKRLSQRSWSRASFLTASSFSASRESRDSFSGWLSDLRGRAKSLVEEVDTADLVVMISAAKERAEAASLIGEACSLKRVMTTSLIIGGADVSDQDLSETLAHLRPWSLMLVIASGEEYIEDMLTALRA